MTISLLDQLADALRAMIASAADNKCGLRIADEALAAYDARGAQGEVDKVKERAAYDVWYGENVADCDIPGVNTFVDDTAWDAWLAALTFPRRLSDG